MLEEKSKKLLQRVLFMYTYMYTNTERKALLASVLNRFRVLNDVLGFISYTRK